MNEISSKELVQDILAGKNAYDQLCMYEENATLWLWAYAQLLCWGRDIKWLFSPVTGKYPYPGDLWGIDSAGDLIIIETKLGKKRQDPFRDFVGFEAKLKVENQCIFREESLLEKWQGLHAKEKSFIERYSQDLRSGANPKFTFPGIVPYSSKRETVWQWRHLYLNIIVPSIGNDYRQDVCKYLQRRSTNKTATQQYFGIILAFSKGRRELSENGIQNRTLLQDEIGIERVHLRFIDALFTKENSVLLKSEVA